MQGSCLCGAVRFEATPPLRDLVVCHCSQCRKTSGHIWSASSVPLDRFGLQQDSGLAWYRSSGTAVRGFCRHCGASLFWQPDAGGTMHFAPGALDGPTSLVIAVHIFTEDAGDYYAPEGPPPPPRRVEGRLSASCLCGSVRLSLSAPAGPVTACHCTQCRKLSGHSSASFEADEAAIVWDGRTTLAEYATPGGARRGFSAGCGSSLYFRSPDGTFSVEAGAVDGPTGGTLVRHIHLADRGDYEVIDDGLPGAPGDD
jgi:hypothetical protein